MQGGANSTQTSSALEEVESQHESETSSVSQAGESPPQVHSELEHGTVITNDNASQEKVSQYQ